MNGFCVSNGFTLGSEKSSSKSTIINVVKLTLDKEDCTCTKITEVNLSAFVYRLFHEDFSPIVGSNLIIWSDDWREIFMKQSVNKCR